MFIGKRWEWHEKLLDVADNCMRSWQKLEVAPWDLAGFHRWLRGSKARNDQASQITELGSVGPFPAVVLRSHQCPGNCNTNTLLGYKCSKTGIHRKKKRPLFIWYEVWGWQKGGSKKGQRMIRCTDPVSRAAWGVSHGQSCSNRPNLFWPYHKGLSSSLEVCDGDRVLSQSHKGMPMWINGASQCHCVCAHSSLKGAGTCHHF